MRKVVVNTTPLIALADIGQLELLHQLYSFSDGLIFQCEVKD